tara:strand:+ start:322 stop:465 length:144 start_codon:yes stop_codon:yes gene_type:complete
MPGRFVSKTIKPWVLFITSRGHSGFTLLLLAAVDRAWSASLSLGLQA